MQQHLYGFLLHTAFSILSSFDHLKIPPGETGNVYFSTLSNLESFLHFNNVTIKNILLICGIIATLRKQSMPIFILMETVKSILSKNDSCILFLYLRKYETSRSIA